MLPGPSQFEFLPAAGVIPKARVFTSGPNLQMQPMSGRSFATPEERLRSG